MFTDDLDEAIYQARLAARRRDEHIRAEGAINALDVAEPRIRELEAEAQRLYAMIAELREENAVFVDASRRLAALEAENGRLRAALDIISNPGVQYPWAECARIARKALAQQPNPAHDKEQRCGRRIYVGTTGESACELPSGHDGKHRQGSFMWAQDKEQP